MKFEVPHTLKQIAEILGCTFLGNEAQIVTGINEIHMVEEGDLVFVDHPKYYEKAINSAATCILIDVETEFPEGKSVLIHPKPFEAFNQLILHFSNKSTSKNSEETVTFPNVFIGKNVQLGKNITLYPGVCILDNCIIEDGVIIGANTVIGHDAFYYQKKEGNYNRLNSCGTVHIESNVEIGASCTIDRGVTGTTRIGKGTKIDNLVQVGHDTQIGENCLIAAQVGIAGCVKIADEVTLWGQVGIASGVSIGEKSTLLAQSGVSKDLAANGTYFGSPCGEVKVKFKEMAALRNLPKFLEEKR